MAVVILALLSMLGAAFSKILADEFKDWTPWICKRLISIAVSLLPEKQKERLHEEWAGHYEDVPGNIGKIIYSVGCVKAGFIIANPNYFSLGIKRVMDVAFAVNALFVLSPVFIALYIAIKLESPGPVFIRSPRLGKDRKIFDLYKFRSMRIEATYRDEQNGIRADAVIPFVGSFLRRTHIDELPQLINVLKGDMSLVGPRPHIIDYGQLSMRPGLASLASVSYNGNVNDIDAKRQHRSTCDKLYVENYSLMLDIKIIYLAVLDELKYGLFLR